MLRHFRCTLSPLFTRITPDAAAYLHCMPLIDDADAATLLLFYVCRFAFTMSHIAIADIKRVLLPCAWPPCHALLCLSFPPLMPCVRSAPECACALMRLFDDYFAARCLSSSIEAADGQLMLFSRLPIFSSLIFAFHAFDISF